MAEIGVIGSGISGLAAACIAAQEGNCITVFEKNSTIGGRARHYTENGFLFDMGPSWYWMPDVFERFFNQFGKSTSDYFELKQLDPGFRMFFADEELLDVPANLKDLFDVFENKEAGSSNKLQQLLKDGAFKYQEGMLRLALMPSISWREYADLSLMRKASQLKLFTSVSHEVRKLFKHPHLIALLEFPALFLGAMPWKIPALYTLMNYAALELGTWYPMGGMYKLIDSMHALAVSLGVKFETSNPVEQLIVNNSEIEKIKTANGIYDIDAVIGSCDYAHLEQQLLTAEYRNYPSSYWEKRTFAPSCLIFYLGCSKKIPNLIHHNLFFDTDLELHAKEIYKSPSWPTEPLFYVCCPSKTDNSVAPQGQENLFILMPIATGLKDNLEKQDFYFDMIMSRMEKICKTSIKEHIVYKKAYSVSNFIQDYNAYKGNAYGLANTLMQTAFLKPKMINKRVKNLFYAGQLTVPGPGLPPGIMSGEIAAKLVSNYFINK